MEYKVGQKVRIVKCCAPFFGKILLGKVDTIKRIYDIGDLHLEKLHLNVKPCWVELVDDDAVDIEMELNESTIQQIE